MQSVKISSRSLLASSLVLGFCVLLPCGELRGQNNSSSNETTAVKSVKSDEAGVVASIRVFELPVSIDKNDQQQCELINQLLCDTDVRNIEIQCPSVPGAHSGKPWKNPMFASGEPDPQLFCPANSRKQSVIIVKLDGDAVKAFVDSASDDSLVALTMAPTVSMFSGQAAEIQTGHSRNFVTGCQPPAGESTGPQRPLVSTIPEGLRIQIVADSGESGIGLDVTVEDWSIDGVEEILVKGHDGEEFTLQVPDVNVESASATATVAPDQSLLLISAGVDSGKKASSGVPLNSEKKLFRKASPASAPTRTAILITVTATENVSTGGDAGQLK